MTTRQVILGTALVLALPAVAQEQLDPDDAIYQETTLVDFDQAVRVGGAIHKPALRPIFEIAPQGHPPMLRYRESFQAESLASLDEVR